MDAKKVVLAYSGGLDTSVLIKWFVNKGFKVIAFLADLGQNSDFKMLEDKAKKCGADKVVVEDLKSQFVYNFVFPTLKSEAIYESNYFLSTALGRPLIAQKLVEVAKQNNADTVAHGCSGKGNDQVRFEVAIATLGPNLNIVAPLREWEFKSREEELSFAENNSIPVDVTKQSLYSIDKNLWGVSIECGELEDPSVAPADDAYQITLNPKDSPDKAELVDVAFEKGIPVSVNGVALDGVDLINKVSDLGCKHGIGRIDMIEDRLVGIKSREIYEAPAAKILYTAHSALESLVLSKDILDFRKIVSDKYAHLIYNGLWFTELKTALDNFINIIQEKVCGKVKLELYKGNCICVGRESKYSLYNRKLSTYDKEDIFDHKAAEGFIKIFGLPYRQQMTNDEIRMTNDGKNK